MAELYKLTDGDDDETPMAPLARAVEGVITWDRTGGGGIKHEPIHIGFIAEQARRQHSDIKAHESIVTDDDTEEEDDSEAATEGSAEQAVTDDAEAVTTEEEELEPLPPEVEEILAAREVPAYSEVPLAADAVELSMETYEYDAEPTELPLGEPLETSAEAVFPTLPEQPEEEKSTEGLPTEKPKAGSYEISSDSTVNTHAGSSEVATAAERTAAAMAAVQSAYGEMVNETTIDTSPLAPASGGGGDTNDFYTAPKPSSADKPLNHAGSDNERKMDKKSSQSGWANLLGLLWGAEFFARRRGDKETRRTTKAYTDKRLEQYEHEHESKNNFIQIRPPFAAPENEQPRVFVDYSQERPVTVREMQGAASLTTVDKENIQRTEVAAQKAAEQVRKMEEKMNEHETAEEALAPIVLAEGQRLEHSVWHNVVVDKHGHEVTDAIEYGKGFHQEQREVRHDDEPVLVPVTAASTHVVPSQQPQLQPALASGMTVPELPSGMTTSDFNHRLPAIPISTRVVESATNAVWTAVVILAALAAMLFVMK